jgi:hypothetical protein
MLTFGNGNAKLNKTATFSLPAGFTCPGALKCLAFANRETGLLKDGSQTEFRCFAASQETFLTNVRVSRWNNFEALRKAGSVAAMAALLDKYLPPVFKVRIHVSGDFFSLDYLDAWIEVAKKNPQTKFYAYTKAINFWVARFNQIPANFVLNASYGGRYDDLIGEHNLKSARVVYSVQEALDLGLEIDHDDSHASDGTKSFALLIHGSQPAKSEASRAVSALRKAGHKGYGKDIAKKFKKYKGFKQKTTTE